MTYNHEQLKKCDTSEYKVVFAVVLFMILVDSLIRITGSSLSGNIRHMQSIASVVEKYKISRDKANFLFLGNSLTNEAIDVNVFKNEVSTLGLSNIFVDKITPDATSLWEWYYIYKNHFVENNVPLKVGVSGFAWMHLADQNRVDPSRLAGYFSSIEDIPELVLFGMNSTAEVLEFMVAKVSQVYVTREVIRKRSLDLVIPHYRGVTQYINNAAGQPKAGSAEKSQQLTYTKLGQLVRQLKEKNIKQIFIAMPVLNKYEIDPELTKKLMEHDVILLDYRNLSEIQDSHFVDRIHLGEEGRAIFTRKLAQDLATNYSSLF